MSAEAPEGIRFEANTVSLEEFKNMVAPKRGRDPRFISGGEQYVFEFLEESDFETGGLRSDSRISYLKMNELVVGVVLLHPSSTNNHSAMKVSIVTIDKNLVGLRRSETKENRELRLSARLLEEVFRYAKKHNKSLEVSTFTNSGFQRLYSQFIALSKKTGVPVSLPHDEG